MISHIKTFFNPATHEEKLRNIILVLSAAIAISFIAMLVHQLQVNRQEVGISDSDRLGMIILTDRASRK